MTEPVVGTTALESSTHEPPPEPAQDIPIRTADPPAEQVVDSSENPGAPSPVRPDDPQNPDVEITGIGFVEPVRPNILAKCSAKEELLQHRRVKLDVTDYTHLSVGEVFSGYMSQVHSNRDIEINLVKQMHQKFEVQLSLFTYASPQVYCLQ